MQQRLPSSAHLSRRSFLGRSAAAAACAGLSAGASLPAAGPQSAFDLIVAGATVIDPYRKRRQLADIGIKDGKIAMTAAQLDRSAASQVLDAKGLLASPGWIDLHAHVFFGHKKNAVHPDRDAGVHTGVTTLADPGGFVSSEFDLFRSTVVAKSATRVLGFVNISATRYADRTTRQPVHGDWSLFDQELTIKTIVENRDVIQGVKVLSSVRHSGNLGITPTRLAVQAARESGTRVMAHIGMAPPLIQDVLNLLEQGDIITHCFKGFPSGLFHRDGTPVVAARRAIERGVSLDLGHGAGSFAWAAARHALATNIPLHSLSTDLHQGNVRGPVWSYGRTMAKLLHLGYPIEEVVKLSTLGPAELIGQGCELGSLEPGSVADVTLFRIVEAPTVLTDSLGNSEIGRWDVQPVHCIRSGRVIDDMKIPPREAASR